MSHPIFYVPAGDIIPIFFDSYDGGTGASITMTGLAITDVEVYKDVSMTQRASDAGVVLIDTDGIDIDGITGIHGFSIDTGDNTDASFYTVGAWFTVVVSAITIDAQTVNFVAAQFRIMAAEHTAGYPVATIKDGTGTGEIDTTSGGVLVAAFAANSITAAAIAAGAIDAATFAADVDAEILSYIVDDATRIDASALNTAAVTTVPAILVDTAEIGAAGAGLTALPYNGTAWDAEIQSEVTDALNAYDPPTRAEATSDLNSVIAYLVPMALRQGVIGSTGNDTTHLHLDGYTYGDDEINNMELLILDASEGEYHTRWVEDWVLATELATVATLPFTPQNATDVVYLISARKDVTTGSGLDAAGVRAAVGLASANLDTQIGDLPTNAELTTALGTADDAVLAILGTPAGASVSADIAAIEAQTDDIGVAGAGLTAAPWNAAWDAEVQSEVADALAVYDPPTHTELTTALGTADDAVLAILGTPAGASMSADIAAIEAQTDDIGAAGAGLTAVGWNPAWDAEVQSEVADALAVYDPPTQAEVVTAVGNLLTTQLTESYAADGVAPTVAQALCLIAQGLLEFSISGTTLTVKKLDGATTAATYTFDSATVPTSRTRTT